VEHDLAAVDQAVDRLGADPAQIIGILQDIQREMNYLPQWSLERVAERLGVPLIQVYRVASFYRAFSLTPRGRCRISVCLGTACHVREGSLVLSAFERTLGVPVGETTPDLDFTLERVGCLGACALGPVVQVDENVHDHMDALKAERLVRKMKGGERGR